MEILLDNIWMLLLMVLLLGASGTFSGSETAFFNISPRKAKLLQSSNRKIESLAGSLLYTPKKLLICLLLANMLVNVAYFSLVSSFLVKNSQQLPAVSTAILAGLFFFALLLFGEMLPKSLAFKDSEKICVIAALPCYICIKILNPIQYLFTFLVIEPILRLSGFSKRRTSEVTVDQLKELIETTNATDVKSGLENQVLTRIIEMNVLKVRHILKPRVDIIFCPIEETVEKALNLISENNLNYLPIYEKYLDNIKGIVYLSDIYKKPDKQLSELITPVHFIPEQKNVESTFLFLQKNNIDVAFAVDEYGGIVGSVEIENISDLLFSNLHREISTSIEKIGGSQYRLSGDLPLQEWAQAFGISPQQTRFTTISGLILALLDKAPHTGDSVNIRNLRLTVEQVKDHRIQSVILNLGEKK